MFRVLLVAALVAPAVAQEEGQYSVDVEKAKEIVTAEEKQPDGWHYKLVLGANGSYTHNSSVVGLEDGSYVQIGIFLDGELTLRSGQHTWRNTLGIKYQQGKTPTIDPWVKSADELKFISLYRYALESVPWMGPFARFRLTTSMFPSEVVRAADATVYNASEIETPINDRTTGEALAAQDTAEITGAFEPLILRETVGLFALPIESKKLNIEVSLGAGAQEVFTSGGRTFKEEKEEDVRDANGMVTGDKQLSIFLTDLPDSFPAIGAELDAAITGEINTSLSWGATVNVLQPFYNTNSDLELKTNYDLGAKLSAKLSAWASLDYVLSAKLVPLVLDEWQVSNNLLVTAAFNLL